MRKCQFAADTASNMGPRVFLCDDSPGYRALLRAVLDGSAEVVGEADDGPAGVRGVAATAPDVLVLDLHMPGGDGLAALEALRRLPDPPRVVVVSASPLEEVERLTSRAACAACLPKGASHDQLRDAVLAAAA